MELNKQQLIAIVPYLREFGTEFMCAPKPLCVKLLRSSNGQYIYDSLITWAMMEDALGTPLILENEEGCDQEAPETIVEGVRKILDAMIFVSGVRYLRPSWEDPNSPRPVVDTSYSSDMFIQSRTTEETDTEDAEENLLKKLGYRKNS